MKLAPIICSLGLASVVSALGGGIAVKARAVPLSEVPSAPGLSESDLNGDNYLSLDEAADYALRVLDRNHDGWFSGGEIAEGRKAANGMLSSYLVTPSNLVESRTNLHCVLATFEHAQRILDINSTVLPEEETQGREFVNRLRKYSPGLIQPFGKPPGIFDCNNYEANFRNKETSLRSLVTVFEWKDKFATDTRSQISITK